MATQSVNKRFSASVRGLITEGNELLSPENSNLKESNYEILHDGTRRRRRPLIQEKADLSTHRQLDRGAAVSTHLWMTPARQEDLSIVAEEVEGFIRFYKLDHNDLTHISENQLDDELDLRLWGRFSTGGSLSGDDQPFNSSNPSTYTEGNGSLYIFNRFSGTVRVDLLVTDEQDYRLRFVPIGTWIRDHEGIDENVDLFTRGRSTSTKTGFNGQPVLDQSFIDGIHEDLDNRRAYNLTNQGWPERAIAQFKQESSDNVVITSEYRNTTVTRLDQPARYPAFMDRYLDGRVLRENGVDYFDTSAVLESTQRTGEPAKGARIGHSDFTAAGTLQPIPIRLTTLERRPKAEMSVVPVLDELIVSFRMEEEFVHSLGRPVEDLAAFVHMLTFQATGPDGKIRTGGVSGVFDAVQISDNGKNMSFTLKNAGYAGYTNFRLLNIYVYPSPVYTPHKVEDDDTYDFRTDRRPAAGAFYAGRLWQFGDEHNRIYFSQLVPETNHGHAGFEMARESMCYTANSPTDPDDNAIVATDGGFVVLSDGGTHLQGEVLNESLLITTDTGIFEIKTADSRSIFSADNFTLRRLTTSEVLGHKAMVNLGNEAHVATNEGIVRVFPDERTGILRTEVITHNSIKTEYDELIENNTREVIGKHDPDSRVIRWVFPKEETYTSLDDTSASPMLSFSLQHSAWYRYDFGFGAAIADMIVLPYTIRNPTYNRFRYLVTALNFRPGQTNNLAVEWGIEAEFSRLGPNQWVEEHDPDALFSDFLELVSGLREPPEAFMLTNHHLYGEGQRWSYINYLTAYNREVTTHWVATEFDEDTPLAYVPNITGSTLLSVHWDWFGGSGRKKHTKPQETYRYRRSFFSDVKGSNPAEDRDEDLLVSKQKIPGKGREFRLRWSSKDHHDSHIVGWALEGVLQTQI